MIEIWKDVEGYEGLYKVSNLGRVLGMRGWIIKGMINKNTGYVQVQLSKKGCPKKRVYIYRLVAKAFILNKSNKPVVDHINAVRNDNRVFNLRWVTISENCNNPITLERNVESKRSTISKNAKPILQLTKQGQIMREFNSIHEAGRELNIVLSGISASCSGKRKSAGGFLWKYKNTTNKDAF